MLDEGLMTEQLEGYWFLGCGNLLIQFDFFRREFSDLALYPS